MTPTTIAPTEAQHSRRHHVFYQLGIGMNAGFQNINHSLKNRVDEFHHQNGKNHQKQRHFLPIADIQNEHQENHKNTDQNFKLKILLIFENILQPPKSAMEAFEKFFEIIHDKN